VRLLLLISAADGAMPQTREHILLARARSGRRARSRRLRQKTKGRPSWTTRELIELGEFGGSRPVGPGTGFRRSSYSVRPRQQPGRARWTRPGDPEGEPLQSTNCWEGRWTATSPTPCGPWTGRFSCPGSKGVHTIRGTGYGGHRPDRAGCRSGRGNQGGRDPRPGRPCWETVATQPSSSSNRALGTGLGGSRKCRAPLARDQRPTRSSGAR